METAEIRTEFKRFAGAERFRKFVRFIGNECRGKGRLFFWQEQLWDEFTSKFADARLSPAQILRVFCVCDVHGCELEELPSDDPKGKIRWTPEYDQAKETLFPLGNGLYVSCLRCQSEQQTWIFENRDLCRILRCKSSYEDYVRRHIDQISDAKDRTEMMRQMEPRIKERAAEIAAQMDPGDELWEWDDRGWHRLAGRGGVAIVRDGKIVKKWCEKKS
jgi:hypothetical protein